MMYSAVIHAQNTAWLWKLSTPRKNLVLNESIEHFSVHPPLMDLPCHIAVNCICWKDAVVLSFIEGLCRDCSLSHVCPAKLSVEGAKIAGAFIDED